MIVDGTETTSRRVKVEVRAADAFEGIESQLMLAYFKDFTALWTSYTTLHIDDDGEIILTTEICDRTNRNNIRHAGPATQEQIDVYRAIEIIKKAISSRNIR